MRSRAPLIAAIIAVLICVWSTAAGNALPPTVPTRLESRARVETEGGTILDLPPGWWIVPPPEWGRIDGEMRRLQDTEARLKAERDSYRRSVIRAHSTWRWVAVGALLTGFAAGAAWGATR